MPTGSSRTPRPHSRRAVLALGALLLLLLPGAHAVRAQCTPPSIAVPPADAARHLGQTATFDVQAAGSDLTFRWMHDGVPLTDEGRITGAGTPHLRIDALGLSDAGQYSARVTNSCGDMVSNPGNLNVLGYCPADWNQSGEVDSQDFFDFLRDFFDPEIDCQRTCGFERCITVCFFDFLNAFFSGC